MKKYPAIKKNGAGKCAHPHEFRRRRNQLFQEFITSGQATVLSKVRPFLEDTIKEMMMKYITTTTFPDCFKVADLGCSSGPNALLVIDHISGILDELSREMEREEAPQLQVFLNDLPENDFNNLFKLVCQKEDSSFIAGVPGSFYGRLFPDHSLHLFHSCYSIHWLSQVPRNLVNIGNIYMAKSCDPQVFKAYLEQFESDFTNFLRVRSTELKAGGRMVHTFLGRSIQDPTSNDCCALYALLAKSLLDLVPQGLVKERDVDLFNLPLYTPCKREIREIVWKEGSFKLDKVETFRMHWDSIGYCSNKGFVFNNHQSGEYVANILRAVAEPMLGAHFGGGKIFMDRLFQRYTEHIAEHLLVEKTQYFNIILILTKM